MDFPGPAVLAESSRFVVKLAENRDEILLAQKLRYDVFKLELGRLNNLGGNLDRDQFDDYYAHLLVIDKPVSRVVGTYRMALGRSLPAGVGFYSEQEFVISGLDRLGDRVLELGRSCVAPEFRSGAVVAMLWAGLAAVHRRADFDYMLGCVSLEHTRRSVGWAIYEDFLARNQLSAGISAEPRRGWRLPHPARRSREPVSLELPPLFKGYLRCGARICGPPALDREFGSIDFLVWFDFKNLPGKYIRHFNV